MVRERPSTRYLAVSVARSDGLLIIALRGRTDIACARRFACSCPVSVSSIPGNCPGSRCSTFHVVCPCRIKNSKRFIFFHKLRRSSLLQQNYLEQNTYYFFTILALRITCASMRMPVSISPGVAQL